MRGTLIFLVVLLIAYLFGVRRKNKIAYTLHRLVAWVVSEDDRQYRCNLSLLHYLHNTQIELNIPSSRRITGDIERSHAQVILSDFSSHLADSFFCNKVECEKIEQVCKYSKIDGHLIEIHFFMFQLYKYLHAHQCDRQFANNEMHKKTISYKDHGMWGGPLYDATYELSDFGMVFHKMLYISYKFCTQSSIFSEEVSRFVSEDSFTSVIDTRQISVSRI